MGFMSREVFNNIKPGQQVRIKGKEWVTVTGGRDKTGKLKCGSNTVSRVSLLSDEDVRVKPPVKISKPSVVMPSTTPKQKTKHPETLKLEVLLKKYPDKKDEIFDMALNQKMSPDVISGIYAMTRAGKIARQNR